MHRNLTCFPSAYTDHDKKHPETACRIWLHQRVVSPASQSPLETIAGPFAMIRQRYDLAELKAKRHALGWTQKRLAQEAGTHVAAVKYWEARTGTRTGWAISRFAEVLGVKPRPALAHRFVPSPNLFAPMPQPAPRKPKRRPLCGARTRRGEPCRAKALPGKRRCKFHGGHSTGPKTEAGKQAIRIAQRNRWAAYRAAKGAVTP